MPASVLDDGADEDVECLPDVGDLVREIANDGESVMAHGDHVPGEMDDE